MSKLHKRRRKKAVREAQILSLAKLVRGVAIGAALRSGVDREDLESAGWRGAIEAVDCFDPARPASLPTYAKIRILGAVQDYLRTLDHLTRSQRSKAKAAGVVIIAPLSLEGGDPDGPELVVPDAAWRRDTQRAEARIDLGAILRRASLAPRNQAILLMVYTGTTMKLVGKHFGINESRVSQICSHSLQKLRAAA